jgi:diguanylate cyclase (GGDEF)-like protein/PAS domain S-box-containing protein
MSLDGTFYARLIDNLYDGVYFVDTNRVITYWNRSCERITGYSAEQVLGRSCQDNVLNHCTELGDELCKNGCPLTATLGDGGAREANVFLHHADGHRVPVRVRVSPMQDETGQIIGAVETFSDNVEFFNARHKILALEETVTIDSLTRVGNRLLGETRLKTAFVEYQSTETRFGLAFIDLDNFKRINDTYGHEMGDRILHMAGNTLRINLRQTDVVSRWGGEEFLVILNDARDETVVQTLAEKLRNLLERSHIPYNQSEVGVTASIGATLVQPGDNPEIIVARADALMYTSKTSGKNRVTLG